MFFYHNLVVSEPLEGLNHLFTLSDSFLWGQTDLLLLHRTALPVSQALHIFYFKLELKMVHLMKCTFGKRHECKALGFFIFR